MRVWFWIDMKPLFRLMISLMHIYHLPRIMKSCLLAWYLLAAVIPNVLKIQYSKLPIRCYHYLPPGSMHAQHWGHRQSLSSLKLIWNGLHGRFIIQTFFKIKLTNMLSLYMQFWTHRYIRWRVIVVLTQSPTVLIFVDFNDALRL